MAPICLNAALTVLREFLFRKHIWGPKREKGSFPAKELEKRGSREELKEERIPSALFSKEFKARRHHRARKKGLWSRESHQAPLLGIPPSFTLPATGNPEIRDETDSVISFELNPHLWLEKSGRRMDGNWERGRKRPLQLFPGLFWQSTAQMQAGSRAKLRSLSEILPTDRTSTPQQ